MKLNIHIKASYIEAVKNIFAEVDLEFYFLALVFALMVIVGQYVAAVWVFLAAIQHMTINLYKKGDVIRNKIIDEQNNAIMLQKKQVDIAEELIEKQRKLISLLDAKLENYENKPAK